MPSTDESTNPEDVDSPAGERPAGERAAAERPAADEREQEAGAQGGAGRELYRLARIEPHSAGVLGIWLSAVGYLAFVGYLIYAAVERGSINDLPVAMLFGAAAFAIAGYVSGYLSATAFNVYGRRSGGLLVRLRVEVEEPAAAVEWAERPVDLLAPSPPTAETKRCPVCSHRVGAQRSFCPECDHSFE